MSQRDETRSAANVPETWIADSEIALARLLRRADVTGDVRKQIVDLRWQLHHLVGRDVRPSDYLGERAENLGEPPTWNIQSNNAEYAAPGLTKWARTAHKLIADLLSALEEAEDDA